MFGLESAVLENRKMPDLQLITHSAVLQKCYDSVWNYLFPYCFHSSLSHLQWRINPQEAELYFAVCYKPGIFSCIDALVFLGVNFIVNICINNHISMSKPRVDTQQKHLIGERLSLELRIHKAEEELMSLEMTDCILAVTKSLRTRTLNFWFTGKCPDLFGHPETCKIKVLMYLFPIVFSPVIFMCNCNILVWP